MSKPASLNYGIPLPEKEKKRIVVNLYESGIGENLLHCSTVANPFFFVMQCYQPALVVVIKILGGPINFI
jgi:hypothetical protein